MSLWAGRSEMRWRKKEAIETLYGRGPEDLTELCLRGGSVILVEAGLAVDEAEGRRRMQQVLEDGSAIRKLKAMVAALSKGGLCDAVYCGKRRLY